MTVECIVCDGLGCEHCPNEIPANVDESIAELQSLAERADRLEKALRELSECVMNGWTSPAFVRGSLHNRAVEIASAALAVLPPPSSSRVVSDVTVCPTCGTPCEVVGHTTRYFRPLADDVVEAAESIVGMATSKVKDARTACPLSAESTTARDTR